MTLSMREARFMVACLAFEARSIVCANRNCLNKTELASGIVRRSDSTTGTFMTMVLAPPGQGQVERNKIISLVHKDTNPIKIK
jgi:hypothetical protein